VGIIGSNNVRRSNQAGGQIILTAKQLEHQSGTIQTESRLQFRQILTDRLEIVYLEMLYLNHPSMK